MRRLALFFASAAALWGCDKPAAAPGGGDAPAGSRTVVLYCSLDEPFSRFIKADFLAKTGITVKYQTDVEADKSVGLRTLLQNERNNPRCDVFWNNEPGNTEVLRQDGLLAPYKSPEAAGIPERYMDPDGYWTGFAARARVLIVNTDLVKPDQEPKRFDDILEWGDKAAIALPVAGTTATHATALFVAWGEAKAKAYFQKIKDAGVVVATGNAHVMNMVADGEVAVGWTDTDDVHVAVKKGQPVKVIYPDQGPDDAGTFVLPNTVMLIKGGPNPEEGKALIDYLLSKEIEAKLAAGDSVQMPLHPGVTVPDPAPPGFLFDHTKIKAFEYDARTVGEQLPAVVEEMKRIFVR